MSRVTEETILLRSFCPDEAGELVEAVRETVGDPWLPWARADYQLDEARQWILARRRSWAEGSEFAFAVRDVRDGRLLGGCGLGRFDGVHRFANLAYWVRAGEAGRGIASAAAVQAARFGLDHLALKRVELVIPVEHAASQRVAEKAGARREAVLRNRLRIDGRPRDAVLFSLVREDLE